MLATTERWQQFSKANSLLHFACKQLWSRLLGIWRKSQLAAECTGNAGNNRTQATILKSPLATTFTMQNNYASWLLGIWR